MVKTNAKMVETRCRWIIVHNIKFLRLFENQVIQDLSNQVTDFFGFWNKVLKRVSERYLKWVSPPNTYRDKTQDRNAISYKSQSVT